uniref:Uncharacterized protein n=1 Tax=Plectus sambesii TaxID=2011161 RepID=A0A914WW69_9BILA
MQLSIASCRLVFDNAVVLGDVLAYATKRQSDAKASDRPPPFLRSLSLIALPNCCDERILRLQMSADGQTAAAMDQIMARQMERISRLDSAAASSAFYNMIRRGSTLPPPPPTQPPSAPAFALAARLLSDDDDDFFEHPEDDDDDDGAPPPHPATQNEATRNLLQLVFDQCDGLKVLNVDSLLIAKALSVAALRYPTTLTQLKTARLGKTPGELHSVVANCPSLQVVDELSGGFTRDEADVRALVSLSDLRALSIVSSATGDDVVRLADLSLAAFGEHPYGTHILHPWTSITSIALNYATGVFLQLLSRGCPTLQEVRIQALPNTPVLTEQSITYLSDLPALRVLIVEDKNDDRAVMMGDSLMDAIACKCPHLEQLCLFPCSVALLSLPRLLRECPRLRSVTLRSLSIALETLDCLVMVRSLAHDLSERKVTTVVQVREITGEDYTSVGRIIDGLGAGTVMAMSSMTDSCVHDLEVCVRCCFDAPEARANARRVELGGRDTCPRSFILAQRRRPHAAIVFSAPPSLKSGGESGRRA